MLGHCSSTGACLKEAIYYISSTFSVEAPTDCMIFAIMQSLHAKLCDTACLMLAESMMTVNWIVFSTISLDQQQIQKKIGK